MRPFFISLISFTRPTNTIPFLEYVLGTMKFPRIYCTYIHHMWPGTRKFSGSLIQICFFREVGFRSRDSQLQNLFTVQTSMHCIALALLPTCPFFSSHLMCC